MRDKKPLIACENSPKTLRTWIGVADSDDYLFFLLRSLGYMPYNHYAYAIMGIRRARNCTRSSHDNIFFLQYTFDRKRSIIGCLWNKWLATIDSRIQCKCSFQRHSNYTIVYVRTIDVIFSGAHRSIRIQRQRRKMYIDNIALRYKRKACRSSPRLRYVKYTNQDFTRNDGI